MATSNPSTLDVGDILQHVSFRYIVDLKCLNLFAKVCWGLSFGGCGVQSMVMYQSPRSEGRIPSDLTPWWQQRRWFVPAWPRDPVTCQALHGLLVNSPRAINLCTCVIIMLLRSLVEQPVHGYSSDVSHSREATWKQQNHQGGKTCRRGRLYI